MVNSRIKLIKEISQPNETKWSAWRDLFCFFGFLFYFINELKVFYLLKLYFFKFYKNSLLWYYKCNKKCTINVTKDFDMEVEIENRIREFRKEKNLSQHKLAKLVGLKRRSIMAYENNTISPSLETAYKICKVLDKDIKEVFIFK
ncbi:DNA-binding helix-turn-helix protein [Anaerococcus vaginalis ATCC 51170]|uniref:DNA-binding helix-turn-helix protein n=3 Tax=Anaerococcus TaxID=165779 RepID=C7HW08_9FIRM|nr:DNA-binding helix-turn-helix protein [Anaerococcus vaginalis ATCC 51170]